MLKGFGSRLPLGRAGESSDVGEAIVMLLLAEYTTGVCLCVRACVFWYVYVCVCVVVSVCVQCVYGTVCCMYVCMYVALLYHCN